MFVICLDYILNVPIDLIKQNGFALKKKSRLYAAENMTGADVVNDLAFLANTTAQAESLLHSLKQAARGIGLYVNANKTKFTCFKQEGATFTLSGKPVKLVDQLTFLGSNILFTESDVNICMECY